MVRLWADLCFNDAFDQDFRLIDEKSGLSIASGYEPSFGTGVVYGPYIVESAYGQGLRLMSPYSNSWGAEYWANSPARTMPYAPEIREGNFYLTGETRNASRLVPTASRDINLAHFISSVGLTAINKKVVTPLSGDEFVYTLKDSDVDLNYAVVLSKKSSDIVKRKKQVSLMTEETAMMELDSIYTKIDERYNTVYLYGKFKNDLPEYEKDGRLLHSYSGRPKKTLERTRQQTLAPFQLVEESERGNIAEFYPGIYAPTDYSLFYTGSASDYRDRISGDLRAQLSNWAILHWADISYDLVRTSKLEYKEEPKTDKKKNKYADKETRPVSDSTVFGSMTYTGIVRKNDAYYGDVFSRVDDVEIRVPDCSGFGYVIDGIRKATLNNTVQDRDHVVINDKRMINGIVDLDLIPRAVVKIVGMFYNSDLPTLKAELNLSYSHFLVMVPSMRNTNGTTRSWYYAIVRPEYIQNETSGVLGGPTYFLHASSVSIKNDYNRVSKPTVSGRLYFVEEIAFKRNSVGKFTTEDEKLEIYGNPAYINWDSVDFSANGSNGEESKGATLAVSGYKSGVRALGGVKVAKNKNKNDDNKEEEKIVIAYNIPDNRGSLYGVEFVVPAKESDYVTGWDSRYGYMYLDPSIADRFKLKNNGLIQSPTPGYSVIRPDLAIIRSAAESFYGGNDQEKAAEYIRKLKKFPDRLYRAYMWARFVQNMASTQFVVRCDTNEMDPESIETRAVGKHSYTDYVLAADDTPAVFYTSLLTADTINKVINAVLSAAGLILGRIDRDMPTRIRTPEIAHIDQGETVALIGDWSERSDYEQHSSVGPDITVPTFRKYSLCIPGSDLEKLLTWESPITLITETAIDRIIEKLDILDKITNFEYCDAYVRGFGGAMHVINEDTADTFVEATLPDGSTYLSESVRSKYRFQGIGFLGEGITAEAYYLERNYSTAKHYAIPKNPNAVHFYFNWGGFSKLGWYSLWNPADNDGKTPGDKGYWGRHANLHYFQGIKSEEGVSRYYLVVHYWRVDDQHQQHNEILTESQARYTDIEDITDYTLNWDSAYGIDRVRHEHDVPSEWTTDSADYWSHNYLSAYSDSKYKTLSLDLRNQSAILADDVHGKGADSAGYTNTDDLSIDLYPEDGNLMKEYENDTRYSFFAYTLKGINYVPTANSIDQNVFKDGATPSDSDVVFYNVTAFFKAGYGGDTTNPRLGIPAEFNVQLQNQ